MAIIIHPSDKVICTYKLISCKNPIKPKSETSEFTWWIQTGNGSLIASNAYFSSIKETISIILIICWFPCEKPSKSSRWSFAGS